MLKSIDEDTKLTLNDLEPKSILHSHQLIIQKHL